MYRAVAATLCGLALAFSAAAEAPPSGGKSFYRWTDAEGKVHYGDRLPPEQAQTGGIKFNASGARKQVLEGAKTPEQLAAMERLKYLRKEQARLLSEQEDHDQSLLRSFRNEDEVRMALQGNLNTLNAQTKVVQANLQRQQEKLGPQQQQVDNLQKAGKAVPKAVADNLAAVQRQVANYQDQIAKFEQQKGELAERAERDVARLNTLKAIRHNNAGDHTATVAAQGDAQELLAGAVSCPGKAQCEKGWAAARAYVQSAAPGPLSIDTERILRSQEPDSEGLAVLLVVRVAEKTGDTLFLDVYCARSSIGQALCASPEIQAKRQAFNQAVTAGLAAQQ